MKILVIFISHKMSLDFIEQVTIFDKYMKELPHTIEYAGISSFDDFHNYESIINFKYKMINPKRQITKLSDFLTTYKTNFDYDLFINIYYCRFRKKTLKLCVLFCEYLRFQRAIK